MKSACLVFAMLVVAFSPASWAQIYRHVDEDGVVRFSDTPPALEDFRVIEQAELDAITTTVPGGPLPSAADRRRSEEAQQRNRAARASSQRRLQASRDARLARCDGYQARLEAIQRRLRAGYRVEEGTRLRERRRETRAVMARECR